MQLKYKGHRIEIDPEVNSDGSITYFYSIFTECGYECETGFFEKDTLQEIIERLKCRIDNELNETLPWGMELNIQDCVCGGD